MMHSVDLRSISSSKTELAAVIPRASVDPASAAASAAALIDEVRSRGEAALLEQAERFDGIRPPQIRIHARDIGAALGRLDPAVRAALETSIDRVRQASEAQIPAGGVTTMADGAEVVQRWQPVGRVGLYVPGGKAVYPSSVVMNVVPAQVAGVGSIAIASPPQRSFDGAVHPVILGAAGLLGIDEVYAMGGAGAIGALAYGVPDLSLDPVDVITGPGNVFVAAAKRLVHGRVGIDSEAGPTEILIIADASADPRLVAMDLISQAEHDELAAAILVTDSVELADAVVELLPTLTAATAAAERVAVSLGAVQSAIVLVDDIAGAVAFSNAYGPEHLEIMTESPERVLDSIESAGAIFLGANSPVSLGDYLAGSNHVLPTGGGARFSSGLGAHTFLRPQQIVRYSRDALQAVRDDIIALADAEGLPAHGEAVAARFSG